MTEMYAHQRRSAFSLIELVIVIVIIGIIGAIAIPRMSRGAAGASDSALKANLSLLRNAIDLFNTEHNGKYPVLADLEKALTTYSNEAGTAFQATKDTTYIYGPYLRAIPPLPVGNDRGKNTIVATYTAGNGWVYNATTGQISANTDTETDEKGVKYNTY
jgi:general secretion pathway protein G